MERIFEEFYITQENGKITEYMNDHWDELLSFLDNDPDKMQTLINLAIQCIQSDNKEIFTQYTNNLIKDEVI